MTNKINKDGQFVTLNNRTGIWEISNKAWSWSDISKGFKRESKRNFKQLEK